MRMGPEAFPTRAGVDFSAQGVVATVRRMIRLIVRSDVQTAGSFDDVDDDDSDDGLCGKEMNESFVVLLVLVEPKKKKSLL